MCFNFPPQLNRVAAGSMLQCVKKQTLPFSNKIFRFYFSPCRIFLFSGSSATAELTQQRLRPNCSKFKQATDTGDSHTFSVTQPRLQFPFCKWEMSKKFQSPSCLKHCSFDFPAPVVRKAVGAYAQDDARPGGEIGDVFPKCGIARRETYFGATWS